MFRRTVSGSLAPSDSLSQRLSMKSSGSIEPREIQGGNTPFLRTPRPQPAIRPNDLPFEILWQKDDCKLDTGGARPIESNSGHPRMKYAIRNRDGTTIDKVYFKSIQKAVTTHVATLVQEEEERLNKSLPLKQIGKKYFESCRSKQWNHVIVVIEDQYPILAYAAAHWKTEQLLTMQLTSRRNHQSKKDGGHPSKKTKRSAKSSGKEGSSSESESDEGNSEEADNDGRREKVVAGSKRKRAQSTSEIPSEIPATPATTVQDTTVMDVDLAEPRRQDVEMEPPEPSAIVVKKRLGKQGMCSNQLPPYQLLIDSSNQPHLQRSAQLLRALGELDRNPRNQLMDAHLRPRH